MTKALHLLDTHALFFWVTRNEVSTNFIAFIDRQGADGALLVSSISFWELALLNKKKRIRINNLHRWCLDVIELSPATIVQPSVDDMIASTLLPDLHKDPFDRLIIAQAKNLKAKIVTRDGLIRQYPVKTLWVD